VKPELPVYTFKELANRLILFYSNTSKVWCFSQTFIFPPLFNALVWRCRWPIAVVVGTLS